LQWIHSPCTLMNSTFNTHKIGEWTVKWVLENAILFVHIVHSCGSRDLNHITCLNLNAMLSIWEEKSRCLRRGIIYHCLCIMGLKITIRPWFQFQRSCKGWLSDGGLFVNHLLWGPFLTHHILHKVASCRAVSISLGRGREKHKRIVRPRPDGIWTLKPTWCLSLGPIKLWVIFLHI